VKVLYDLTYATRGKSGIPKDTKQVALALSRIKSIDTDFILSPKRILGLRNSNSKKTRWLANEINASLNNDFGRLQFPPLANLIRIVKSAVTLRRKVSARKMNFEQSKNILSYVLDLQGQFLEKPINSVLIYPISLQARFARPKKLGLFKLNTNEYDFFIQQQVDPIQVSRNTLHIIRLHDFLPVQFPQYFDALSVKVFNESLEKMIARNDKVWVFDSKHTAVQFNELFGEQRTYAIPCAIETNFLPTIRKRNQILMVNTIEPRKRVDLAIQSFLEAKRKRLIDSTWKLKIIGANGWLQDDLFSNLKSGRFGKDVLFTSNASDYEISLAYSESRVVFSASKAEGFGLPPLEGMAYGCLPLISDIPQHRETIRDFGMYFDGSHIEQIAELIGRASAEAKRLSVSRMELMRKHILDSYSPEVIQRKWEVFLSEIA
jgi:glycosyltransferase involved in cell wall biosynthesis